MILGLCPPHLVSLSSFIHSVPHISYSLLCLLSLTSILLCPCFYPFLCFVPSMTPSPSPPKPQFVPPAPSISLLSPLCPHPSTLSPSFVHLVTHLRVLLSDQNPSLLCLLSSPMFHCRPHLVNESSCCNAGSVGHSFPPLGFRSLKAFPHHELLKNWLGLW